MKVQAVKQMPFMFERWARWEIGTSNIKGCSPSNFEYRGEGGGSYWLNDGDYPMEQAIDVALKRMAKVQDSSFNGLRCLNVVRKRYLYGQLQSVIATDLAISLATMKRDHEKACVFVFKYLQSVGLAADPVDQ